MAMHCGHRVGSKTRNGAKGAAKRSLTFPWTKIFFSRAESFRICDVTNPDRILLLYAESPSDWSPWPSVTSHLALLAFSCDSLFSGVSPSRLAAMSDMLQLFFLLTGGLKLSSVPSSSRFSSSSHWIRSLSSSSYLERDTVAHYRRQAVGIHNAFLFPFMFSAQAHKNPPHLSNESFVSFRCHVINLFTISSQLVLRISIKNNVI